MASKPEQEPSIEEILASIRQIISDDDQPRDSDLDLTQEPEEKFEIPVAAPEQQKEKPAASFAEVLDLTNEIREEPEIAYNEEPKFSIPVAEPVQEPAPQPAPAAPTPEPVKAAPSAPAAPASDPIDSIFTETAAEATSAAFSKLMGNIPVERDENKTLYADGRITLEDITKDLLRPMLRDWINANVPKMVERLVEKELEKLARQARDD